MQTLAILIDAYRELNARKLFWISLILSALVVAIFGAIGIDKNGLILFWWHTPFPVSTEVVDRAEFYKFIFITFGIGYWLTWIGTILAVVSTASLMPDFLAGGAVDLYLARPISRLRLFLAKYFAGLVFAALQVTLFTGASFLVIGIRGGVWEPGLFLAIPVVVLFFSYLHCVTTLIGVLTRSSIASILITLIFWMAILFSLHFADAGLLQMHFTEQEKLARLDRNVADAQKTLDWVNHNIAGDATFPASRRVSAEEQLERAQQRRAADEDHFLIWYRLVHDTRAVLPKTAETVELLNRWLTSAAHLEPRHGRRGNDDDEAGPFGATAGDFDNGRIAAEESKRETSLWWVIGTSVAFEAVVLSYAAFRFIRRDY